jgi:hypothetical protein
LVKMPEHAAFAEAEIAPGVADDEVIEERDVEQLPPRGRRRVRRTSSAHGVRASLGCLCITTSAVALGVRHAGTKTSGRETTPVALMV